MKGAPLWLFSSPFDIGGDDDYWTFIENPNYDTLENLFENPIYDMSSEGSVYLEICESLIYNTSSKGSVYSKTYESCKEEQSEFSYDQSKLYLSIYNEDLEKQYSEVSDMMQLTKDIFQPLSSHIDVPYDLEQFWAYTQSY